MSGAWAVKTTYRQGKHRLDIDVKRKVGRHGLSGAGTQGECAAPEGPSVKGLGQDGDVLWPDLE